MKWVWYLIIAALIGGSWLWFAKTGDEMRVKEDAIYALENLGGSDDQIAKYKDELHGLESIKILNGVLLAIFSASLIGVVVVLDVLPAFAQRITHAVYDSAEMMEHDVMHDARSLLAQGDFAGAIEGFKVAAAADPLNRLPWVEIAKIYKDNLRDPVSAIQTIRYALESQEWEVNDAAYFLFRLAELYDEVEGDRPSAVAIMNQVIEHFPGTRHAANATHKLHEWSVQDAAREEEAYLAGLEDAQGRPETPAGMELPPRENGEGPAASA